MSLIVTREEAERYAHRALRDLSESFEEEIKKTAKDGNERGFRICYNFERGEFVAGTEVKGIGGQILFGPALSECPDDSFYTGFFHTHPETPTKPSPEDLTVAVNHGSNMEVIGSDVFPHVSVYVLSRSRCRWSESKEVIEKYKRLGEKCSEAVTDLALKLAESGGVELVDPREIRKAKEIAEKSCKEYYNSIDKVLSELEETGCILYRIEDKYLR